MSETNAQIDVLHNGGNQYHATRGGTIFRVDLDAETPNSMVSVVGQGNNASDEDKRDVLAAVIREGPEYRETMGDHMHISVEAPAAGNAEPSGQSGGSGGSDQQNEDEDAISSTITVEHDHDLEALNEEVTSWLAKAAGFKGSINPGWIEVETAQANIPGEYDHPLAGQTVVGFKVETAPFYTPHWDRDSKWESDEAEEKFDAHREALTGEGGIFRTEDAVLGLKDADGYYDNFIPAASVGDLG